MMMKLFLAATYLLLALPTSALATSVRARTSQQLAQDSDLVIVGRVLERTGSWQGTRIVTTHRIKIDSIWTGNYPDTELEFVSLGGSVGDIGQIVSGSSQLPAGTQAVMFLTRLSKGRFCSVALSQGVFEIDPKDGHTLMRQPLGHVVGPALKVPKSLEALRGLLNLEPLP